MSRLDSAIRRLMAQKLTLEDAAARLGEMPGFVIELGLGNGRTYDHIREIFPGRDFYVFDRQVNTHPDCVPPDDRLFLGDFTEMLPVALSRLGPGSVAMAHLDTGTGDKQASIERAAALVPLIRPLLKNGAIIVSDQPLDVSGAQNLPLPEGVADGRIHFYQV